MLFVFSISRQSNFIQNPLDSIKTKKRKSCIYNLNPPKIKVLEDNNIAKRQTAGEYLRKLETNKILSSFKIGNDLYFINDNLINVLSK